MSESPLRDVELPVPARHLTDPRAARRLTQLFEVAAEHELAAGYPSNCAALADISQTPLHYADELESAHAEVVHDVTQAWGPAPDGGEMPDEPPTDDGDGS